MPLTLVKMWCSGTRRVLGKSIRLVKTLFLTRLIDFPVWLASAQHVVRGVFSEESNDPSASSGPLLIFGIRNRT